MAKEPGVSRDKSMFLSNSKKTLRSSLRKVQEGHFSQRREEGRKQVFLEVSEQYFGSWPPGQQGSWPVE